MADVDLDAIRERLSQITGSKPWAQPMEDVEYLLEHIAELERERDSCYRRANEIDHLLRDIIADYDRLRTAAQAVVAVADGDMNRELLDAIDALDAALEGSTED